MREIRPYGSARGARSNARPYRDRDNEGATREVLFISSVASWPSHGLGDKSLAVLPSGPTAAVKGPP